MTAVFEFGQLPTKGRKKEKKKSEMMSGRYNFDGQKKDIKCKKSGTEVIQMNINLLQATSKQESELLRVKANWC